MFPHVDERFVAGQRYNQWGTVIFVNPRRYSRGLPYYDDGDHRDDPVLLVVAGSVHVRGPVNINYIDKIVVNTRDITFFQTIEGSLRTQQRRDDAGMLEQVIVEGVGGAPLAAQVSPSEYFRQDIVQEHGLLTVYHHRFRQWPIAGWSGGPNVTTITVAPRRQGDPSIARSRWSGGLAISCLACAFVVVLGLAPVLV